MGSYEQDTAAWRGRLEESLRREKGWLALAGLYWLQPGMNTYGSDPGNDIVLPGEETPAQAGRFEFDGQKVFLHVDALGAVYVGESAVDEPVLGRPLLPDTSNAPDEMTLGTLRMVVIQRGSRFGIRVWDKNRPERLSFKGRDWYPPQEDYRVTARFTPFDEVQEIDLPDMTGDLQKAALLGSLEFTLHGMAGRLTALPAGEGDLFIIFRDETSGGETYPAGRYLIAAKPENGTTVLDFNRAYNPPCAFTPYATCPLPPPGNRLNLRVEAGERYPGL